MRALAAHSPNHSQQIVVFGMLGIVLLSAAVLSLFVGPANLDFTEFWAGLYRGEGVHGIIIREIRMPRVLLSITIGGFLGLSGAALQGLLRNPLAEASVFGAPQSAALGAVIVLYLGFGHALSLALPAAAILGAGASSVLLFLLAGRHRSIITLIIAGLAIGSFAGAAVSLVINLSPNPFAVTEVIFWLLGSLEDRSMQHVLISAPFLVIATGMILSQGSAYRALSLGEDVTLSMGINVSLVRVLTAGGVAIGTGGAVAVAGSIGFVGLLAPHLARYISGSDPQRLLWPSALLGAILLTLADVMVRVVPSTTEIKLGAVTALLGAPLFLYLVLSHRYRFGTEGT
jgi:iron complex transport system permease protein